MPTMKEVAALAGVSLGTVSNVLSGLPTVTPELRERVHAAVSQLGYQPNLVARSLKTRQTHTLGMVVSDICNPFFSEVIRGAEDAAVRRGFLLTMMNTGDDPGQERRAVENLNSRRVDGLLIVVALEENDHGHLLDFRAGGKPIVCVDRVPFGLDVDTVSIDNEGSAERAVEHLVSLGHKKIAYIGGRQNMYVAVPRVNGYLNGMKTAGLEPRIYEGDFTRESGMLLAPELLDAEDRPTAVLCANVQITLGVLQVLRDRKLNTPRDLAVATFDYFDYLDAFSPRLTCIVQPSYQIGFEGANLLIGRLLGEVADELPRNIVLPTTLRVAESTVGN